MVKSKIQNFLLFVFHEKVKKGKGLKVKNENKIKKLKNIPTPKHFGGDIF